jgi:hypothetical protein
MNGARRYLTNTSPENKERCLEAAKRSGMDVHWDDEPMPDTKAFLYDREFAVRMGYGSIYTLEPPMRDHGPFWREWRNLTKN